MKTVAAFVTVVALVVLYALTEHPLAFVALICAAVQLARIGLAPEPVHDRFAIGAHRWPLDRCDR